MGVVDDCCKFRNAMVKVIVTILVVLDVFHFKERSVDCLLNHNDKALT